MCVFGFLMCSAEEQQQLLEAEIIRKNALYPQLEAIASELENKVKGELSWNVWN